MTEYSTLTTQTSGGTPGSGWANQIKDNQEALIHPPSARFVSVYEVTSTNGSEASPMVAATYAKVNFCAPTLGKTASTVQGSQSWQNDVASEVNEATEGSSYYVDSTNNTYSGPSILVGADNLAVTNSFKVPRNGVYVLTCSISVDVGGGTAGSLTVVPSLNGTRHGGAGVQVPLSGTGTTGTSVSMAWTWDLVTTDYFNIDARIIGAGGNAVAGHLSITRLAEATV